MERETQQGVNVQKPSRSILLSALIMLLPLYLSQCSHQQGTLKIRGLKSNDAEALAATNNSWEAQMTSRLKSQEASPELLENLGDLFLRNREYESSLLNYLQILKEQPQRYDLRYKLAVIFLMLGQSEAAKQELTTVLKQEPNNVAAHQALGLTYLKEKQYPQAIAEFRYCVAQDSRQAKFRHLLGIAYLEAGNPEKAIPELREAASLDADYLANLIALGRAYLQQQNYATALVWLEKAQALDPENRKTNRYLGMALAGLKRYPAAMEAFRKGGDEAMAYNNIGVHYFMDGRYADAARCFQRALELRPTFYQEAKLNLQRALEKLQQQREDAI